MNNNQKDPRDLPKKFSSADMAFAEMSVENKKDIKNNEVIPTQKDPRELPRGFSSADMMFAEMSVNNGQERKIEETNKKNR